MNRESFLLLALGLAFLLFLLCLWLKRLKRDQTKIVSQDLTSKNKLLSVKKSETYYSKKYGIAGRPDEVKEECGEWIPYEFKSSVYKGRVYPAHIMQLAAYCLLIEDTKGYKPSYGIIEYQNHREPIYYTKELRANLLTQIKKIRNENPEEKDLPPVCEDTRKCRHCGYAWYCHTEQKRLF